MSLTINTEKRRYIRYELLDYAVLDLEGSDDPVSVVVTDIGLGGLQVRAKGVLPKGQSCTVRIASAEGGDHRLPGEVRHTASIPRTELWGIGIRFTPRTHEERIAVAEFVHMVFRKQSESFG